MKKENVILFNARIVYRKDREEYIPISSTKKNRNVRLQDMSPKRNTHIHTPFLQPNWILQNSCVFLMLLLFAVVVQFSRLNIETPFFFGIALY